MNTFLKILSIVALALTIVPSILTFAGHITMETNKILMAIGMVLWFGTAPFWMGKKEAEV
ncbi:MAG: hypothetical protein ACFCUU_17345 [Cyclobacteriaceae bacterium]